MNALRFALFGLSLLLLASCKEREIDEQWARAIVLAKTDQLGQLEQNLDGALRTYARGKEGTAEEREARFDKEVEQRLREATWVTGWAPIELVVEGDEARSGARKIPFSVPKSIDGGSRRTKGAAIGATRRLYWGKFDVGGEQKSGVEILTTLEKDDLTLNVRIFVLPGVPRLEP